MNIRVLIMLVISAFMVLRFVLALDKKATDDQTLNAARKLHSANIEKEILGCNAGYAPACMTMGKIYEHGYYFQPQSSFKAAAFFEKGCLIDTEYEESCTLLGDIVLADRTIQLNDMTKEELYMKICDFSGTSSNYCNISD